MVEKVNPFAKKNEEAANAVESAPVKVEETVKTGRKVLDETNINNTKYVKIPTQEDGIGKTTDVLKISEYFQQAGQWVKGSDGEKFWTGLMKKNASGVLEPTDEFNIEGILESGETAVMRLSSWELVYKVNSLRTFCSKNNFTLRNQTIYFKRIAGGQKNAGKNWELYVPTLEIKITGEDGVISKI